MKKFIIPLLAVAIVVSIMFAGCVPEAAPPAGEEGPPAAPVKAKDVPELQGIIDKGCLDPELFMNPFGEDFLTKPDGTPYRITFVNCFTYCDWCFNQDRIIDSLVTRAGGLYTALDPAFEIDKQIGFIEDVTAVKSADAIIVAPVQEYMTVPATDAAAEAGIEMYAVCQRVYADGIVSFCGNDYSARYLPGYGTDLIGQYYYDMAEKTGKEIHILELWADHSEESSNLRDEGFRKGIAEHPLITIKESPDTYYTTDLLANYTMDAFTADPSLNAIFQQGGGTSGPLEALHTLGLAYPVGHPDHVIMATNECDTDILRSMDDNLVDAFCTNSPLPQAHVVVQNMFNHMVLGKSVEEVIWMPMTLITPENIDTARECGGPAAWARLPVGKWGIWPVLDCSGLGVEMPTKEERMKLMGY